MNGQKLTSRKNPLLQHVRKLLASRSYREQQRQYAADGTKLLAEAVRWCPQALQLVLFTEKATLPDLPEHVQTVEVAEEIMEWVSPMQTPQGALFVCSLPEPVETDPVPGCVILDGIQDPGNLGTILRTADALEVPVYLTPGCADAYSHKTVRASMGAVFRTPPVWSQQQTLVRRCRELSIPLYVTALSDRAVDIRQAPLQTGALVIGSEGQGAGECFLSGADQELIIPMNPKCESLNAAVAAAIVMWQLRAARP